MTVANEPGAMLATLEGANRALAQVASAEDAVQLVDFAEAARVFAKQAKLGTESINHATAIKLKAERRLAEYVDKGQQAGTIATQKDTLKQNTVVRGADNGAESDPIVCDTPKPATLDEIGVDRRRLNEARAIRDTYSDEDIDAVIEASNERDREVSRSELLRESRRQKQLEERAKRDAELAQASPDITTLDKFPILYVDPPWRYDYSPTNSREVENHYPTMSHDELLALDVPAADDAVLLMWVTSPKLAEGLELMQAWGFDYRTSMVWVKDKIGMGYYARQRHELLLIGRKGADGLTPEPGNRPDSVIEAPRLQHSAKPTHMYDLIDSMWPGVPKVELFARVRRDGWAAWGNQA